MGGLDPTLDLLIYRGAMCPVTSDINITELLLLKLHNFPPVQIHHF